LLGLIIAPLAIPAVLGSIGTLRLLQFLPQSWEELGPVVAGLSRALPLSALLFMAAFRRMDPELMDAARLLGQNRWQRYWRIHLPLLAPMAAASAVLAFALTLGECAGMILVLPPGRGTLATRLFNLLHYGAGPDVAALSTLLSLLALAVALLAAWAVQRGTDWRMTP
jgi:iron(III) transport system permease protein